MGNPAAKLDLSVRNIEMSNTGYPQILFLSDFNLNPYVIIHTVVNFDEMPVHVHTISCADGLFRCTSGLSCLDSLCLRLILKLACCAVFRSWTSVRTHTYSVNPLENMNGYSRSSVVYAVYIQLLATERYRRLYEDFKITTQGAGSVLIDQN